MNIALDIVVVSYKLIKSRDTVESPIPLLQDLVDKVGFNQLSSDAPHFVYNINVKILSPVMKEWTIQKRFSELSKLDRDLAYMTKELPYFPARGSRRDLSDECAIRRMEGMNTYFSVISKSQYIVRTKKFMNFFQIDPSIERLSTLRCIGELYPVYRSSSSGGSTSLKMSELSITREKAVYDDEIQFVHIIVPRSLEWI
jgi:hypothetical protein